MLELIVLGQIPGTSIQLSFTQLLQLVGLFVATAMLIYIEMPHYKSALRPRLEHLRQRLALKQIAR